MSNTSSREIRQCLLALAAERSEGDKTFCPSEAARRLVSTDWRRLMPQIRREAAHLVKAGKLRCTQQGQAADPATAHGPIRLSTPCAE